MSNNRLTMWAYPWDLLDEGVPSAVSNIMDRAGTGSVAVAAIYHSGKFLLPHNPRRKIYFPQSGTLYFEPSPEWHGAARLGAPWWTSAAGNDLWRDLGTRIHDRGGELTAWCLGLHNSGLGGRHPECAVQNAFGDTIPTDLCASKPEVVDFLAAAVADAAVQTVADRLLLESFEYMPFQHGYHHEVIGVPMPPREALLLSLCFCDACLTRAQDHGIDATGLRAWVVRKLEGHFDDPFGTSQEFSWEELRDGCGGAVGRYLDVRSGAVSELVARVVHAVRASSSARIGLVDFGPLYRTGADDGRWESGLDLRVVASLVDEIHPTFYATEPTALERSVDDYLHIVPNGVAVHAAIRAILPQVGSRESLAATLRPMQGRVDGMSFYNYGFMARQTLDWIHDLTTDFLPIERVS